MQTFQKSKTWSATPPALRLVSLEAEAGEEKLEQDVDGELN